MREAKWGRRPRDSESAKDETGKRRERLLTPFGGALLALLAVAAPACAGGRADQAPAVSPGSPAAGRSATPSPAPSPSPVRTPVPTLAPTPPATAEPPLPPDPSVSLLTVVDKQHALPTGYVPPDLVAVDGGLAAPGFGGLLLTDEANRALAAMLVPRPPKDTTSACARLTARMLNRSARSPTG